MLGFIAATIGIHVVPNLVMKAIKKTHKGHEVLTATFAAGIELGRNGKKINFNVIDIATYGFGPESMVEYHLGLKIGKKIAGMSIEDQETYIASFKAEINASISKLSTEEQTEVKKTPFMNTLVMFSNNEFSAKVFNKLVNSGIDADATRSAKVIAINATVAGAAAMIDLHTLIQPVICQARKVIGMSKYGKKLLVKNFNKGIKGHTVPKAQRGLIDVMVAPSVLDTMRVGNTMNKLGMKSDLLKDVI